MTATVKYNNDLKFRRQAAFRRMYRARDTRTRLYVEIALMAVFIAAALIMWFADFAGSVPSYVLYITAIIAVYLLSRLLRAAVAAWRVKPSDPSRDCREFHFSESGFTFGPMDETGAELETKWRDVDKVYITKDVIYMLCMGRRHWVSIDKNLITEGTWDDIVGLLRQYLPKRRISG